MAAHATTPEADARFMRIALGLARRMLGATAPNPAVGAIIVDEASGEVIARGWTQAGGRPHAETHVIERAGERARGKTMYVTLEPCSHHGQTPPCANAIVAAGLARVVCAIEDPDARVSGRGLDLLRKAGVTVDVGCCAGEARWVAAGHILRMLAHRPLVTAKIAVSADGLVAAGTGNAPVWVTGDLARAHGHLLRAEADAILVGRGTVVADDPTLDCRLPGLADRSPRRYVLASRLSIPATAKVLTAGASAPATLIAGTEGEVPKGLASARVLRVPERTPGRLDLEAALAALGDDGITRLLVEGGPTLVGALLAAGLVDEVVLYRGATAIGSTGRPPLGDRALDELTQPKAWRLVEMRRLGADTVCIYRSRRHD